MYKTYLDCYIKKEDETLLIGNGLIERQWRLAHKNISCQGVINKKSGKVWQNKTLPMYGRSSDIVFDHTELEVEQDGFIAAKLNFYNRGVHLAYMYMEVHPNSPFVMTQVFRKSFMTGQGSGEKNARVSGIEKLDTKMHDLPYDAIDTIPFSDKHIEVSAYRFQDMTDRHNNLIQKTKEYLYYKPGARLVTYEGNIIVFDAYLEKEKLILIKDGPTQYGALNKVEDDFHIVPGEYVSLVGSGFHQNENNSDGWLPSYGATLGVSNGDITDAYKRHYQEMMQSTDHLFMMSNTWGDRNQDKCVNESFIKKEIDVANYLGLDLVQIDDGWQEGITANSAIQAGGVWEGYYKENDDFWLVNKDKFPNGLASLVNYASDKGIQLALWFSPDSSNDFINWQKDLYTILDLYKQYGIKHFKLDGIKIRSKIGEIRFISFLDMVKRKSHHAIVFNMDITAEKRLGYLYKKEHGTLFVENRYTDWASYYPHYTLRNIWILSELIPSQRLQMELLNNKRNTSLYDDPLGPNKYEMDYLFAITMVTNPLFWMELSSIEQKDKEILKETIGKYKQVRDKFYKSNIKAIGDMPNGISFTGFHIQVDDKSGYLLLFREMHEKDSHTYLIPSLASQDVYLNSLIGEKAFKDDVVSLDTSGRLDVTIKKMRAFSLIEYKTLDQ